MLIIINSKYTVLGPLEKDITELFPRFETTNITIKEISEL